MEIKAIHQAKRGIYGSPRVHAELQAQGQSHCLKLVARLMRENAIRAKHKRQFKVTIDFKPSYPVAPNLLGRDFGATASNQTWAAATTYIHTREIWLYLAEVLDLYSRMIVGWSISSRMNSRLVLGTLEMAVGRGQPRSGLLHYSDQGSQYTWGDYQKALHAHGMICGMSRKGDCRYNAVMESFFHTPKTELVNPRDCMSRREAMADIFEYVEIFYNRDRRNSALGFVTPAEQEMIRLAA